jgi:esterase/lipase superfamily enzyme
MADLVNTPQFAFPFRVVNGMPAVVEQDSGTDYYQNAVVVMRYRAGERTAIPEFGIPDPALRENGVDPGEIIQAVTTWEPDIDVDVIKSAILDGVENVDVPITIYDQDPDLG